MENIKNWDDIQESAFINEEGTYTFKVMSFEERETQNGNACHVYLCETQDKEQIKLSLYVSDKALWKYKLFVKALGVPTTGQVDFTALPNTLIGKKFIGEVKRQADKIDVATGLLEKSKYFEISKFYMAQ